RSGRTGGVATRSGGPVVQVLELVCGELGRLGAIASRSAVPGLARFGGRQPAFLPRAVGARPRFSAPPRRATAWSQRARSCVCGGYLPMKPEPVVWIPGLPSSGKSSLGQRLRSRLLERGKPCALLDGDEVRDSLVPRPGYSPEER